MDANFEWAWEREKTLDEIVESRVGVVPQIDGRVFLPVLSNTDLPLVTTSELKCFRRCKRRHLYTYRMGYRPLDKSGPLRFGSAMHDALEAWSLNDRRSIDAALNAIDANGDMDPFERAKARAMLVAYHCRWADAQYKTVAVEKQFEAPLINPETGAASKTYRVGGKIDMIIERFDGIWIVERKTSGVEVGFDTPYWKKLKLDSQISTYFVGAKALGYDIKGCIYDVLRKPTIRPYKMTPVEQRKYTKPSKTEPVSRLYANQRELDETPDEYEERCLKSISEDPDRFLLQGEVLRTEEDQRDAAFDLWANAKELRESEKASRFPRNPEACETWGIFCEWWEVCTGTASLDDQTRYRRMIKRHEELT